MKDFVTLSIKKDTKKCWIQVVKDMKMSFQSCLETNLSGIGIARGYTVNSVIEACLLFNFLTFGAVLYSRFY